MKKNIISLVKTIPRCIECKYYKKNNIFAIPKCTKFGLIDHNKLPSVCMMRKSEVNCGNEGKEFIEASNSIKENNQRLELELSYVSVVSVPTIIYFFIYYF